MKSRNRLATCVLVTGLLGLSGCVFSSPGHDHDSRQGQAREGHDLDRHDEGDKRCDSDHRGNDCQDKEHR